MDGTFRFRPNSLGPLARFGLLALVPVVILGAILGHELNVDSQQRYLDTATSSATLITRVGVQPLLTAQEVAGGLSPTQVNDVDLTLRGAGLSQEVTRIKVWNRAGTIVYSDNHALIGRTFKIDDDLASALHGSSRGSVTDGHDEENSGDNLAGPLIQVYAPLVFSGTSSPSGAFELYLPYAPVQAAIDRESNRLYLLLAGGLTLFYASMFPVALLAERWRRRLLSESQSAALANLATLERLNKLKSEFLVRISHQFRTAMVGIKGFSELIRDTEQLDMTEVRGFAEDISSDAERLDRAFDAMVELDQLESGATTLAMAPVDVNAIIEEVVDSARRQPPERPFQLTLDPSLPTVPGDGAKLSRVVAILVANATRYSPAGSQVGVSSRADSGYIEVTVRDQGPGMQAGSGADHGRLEAGDDVSAANSTGLGLPTARQIVKMHGGRLWFESAPGGGTRFHFTVPAPIPSVRPAAQDATVSRSG